MSNHRQSRRIGDEELAAALRRMVDDDGPEDLGQRVRRSILRGTGPALPAVRRSMWYGQIAAAALVAVACVGWWWMRHLERTLQPPDPPAAVLTINKPSRFPDPKAFPPIAPHQRAADAKYRLDRPGPERGRSVEASASLMPWGVPDTSIPGWAVYDGFGPAPLQAPAAIDVGTIEPRTLAIDPLMVEALHEPDPIAATVAPGL